MRLFALWHCNNNALRSLDLRHHRNYIHGEDLWQLDESKKGLNYSSTDVLTIRSMINFEAYNLQHQPADYFDASCTIE